MTETRSVMAMISRSLWVMRMTVLPWSRSVREDAEQVIGLVGRQHAGGLVEDQRLGAPEQRLEDFDALLQADGQLADDGVGIDLEFIVAARAASSSARALASAGPMQRAALGAEHDILEHGEGIDQHEVLVHHADAERDGIRRATRDA